MTTFTAGNPAFRRFIFDAETMVPVRVETYVLDIELGKTEFEFHHELSEWYGMKDHSPESFEDFSERLLHS